jgi:hypothetical protein
LGGSEGGQTLSYVFSLEDIVFWFDRLLRRSRLLRFDHRQRISPNGIRRNSPFRKRQGFLKIFTPMLHNTPPTPNQGLERQAMSGSIRIEDRRSFIHNQRRQRVPRELSQLAAFVFTSADLVLKRNRVRRAGARSAAKECYNRESEQ